MQIIDWLVIGAYVVLIYGISIWVNKYLHTENDYYQTGQSMRWWQTGLSTMATQLSAVSFVSIPAFVAVRQGGGLRWLAYEFGVPLGILVVIMVVVPALTERWPITIYEYLENRVGHSTRRLVSGLFLISRGLATGVVVLTGGLVVSTALQVDPVPAIIVIGLLTLVYDLIGGIRVVILSDVLQMGIILIGFITCGIVGLDLLGWELSSMMLEPERARIVLWQDYGFRPGEDYGFWPMLLGGMFLYISYYGCDQSQMQRELSVRNKSELRGSLLLNALGRFPVVVLYCGIGLLLAGILSNPEHVSLMASTLGISTEQFQRILANKPDRILPTFILTYLPPGLVGLLFAGIIAALMSSLDSNINSLSAVTIRDHIGAYFPNLKDQFGELTVSRTATGFWGLFAIGSAIVFEYASMDTVVELINQIGSVLYGPILGAFLLAILWEKVEPLDVNSAVILGMTGSIALWLGTLWVDGFHVSWLWWTPINTTTTLTVGLLMATLRDRSLAFRRDILPDKVAPWYYPILLVGWTLVIVLISLGIERILT